MKRHSPVSVILTQPSSESPPAQPNQLQEGTQLRDQGTSARLPQKESPASLPPSPCWPGSWLPSFTLTAVSSHGFEFQINHEGTFQALHGGALFGQGRAVHLFPTLWPLRMGTNPQEPWVAKLLITQCRWEVSFSGPL